MNETIEFIKNNWALTLALIVLLSPSIWFITSSVLNERMEYLKEQLETHRAELTEHKKRIEDLEEEIDEYTGVNMDLIERQTLHWSPDELLAESSSEN